MRTITLRKTLKPFYTASAVKPTVIDVPVMNVIMVDGTGDPNSAVFQEAAGTLYSVAYTLKFSYNKGRAIDYPVLPLEGLWSADEVADFLEEKRDKWKWTLFIALPDLVTKSDVRETVAAVRKKAKFSGFPAVRFEKLAEGKAAQIFTSGRTQLKALPSNDCTGSWRSRDCGCAAGTTKSISATRGGQLRKS